MVIALLPLARSFALALPLRSQYSFLSGLTSIPSTTRPFFQHSESSNREAQKIQRK
ncbi:hypothetical protein RchiOBHm_Chr7g0186681 [Rosa chinensis]|uniref:Uncharacterized protein n=1 Tax=Rosa chinensis TaxID=74649 RepID=A0A2P6P413_ROSCH|nr:hypothetical protein RchiOBHm_Chr7g0186681 [Rosa chinensis]